MSAGRRAGGRARQPGRLAGDGQLPQCQRDERDQREQGDQLDRGLTGLPAE
jgi:hypothetical protein